MPPPSGLRHSCLFAFCSSLRFEFVSSREEQGGVATCLKTPECFFLTGFRLKLSQTLREHIRRCLFVRCVPVLRAHISLPPRKKKEAKHSGLHDLLTLFGHSEVAWVRFHYQVVLSSSGTGAQVVALHWAQAQLRCGSL